MYNFVLTRHYNAIFSCIVNCNIYEVLTFPRKLFQMGRSNPFTIPWWIFEVYSSYWSCIMEKPRNTCNHKISVVLVIINYNQITRYIFPVSTLNILKKQLWNLQQSTILLVGNLPIEVEKRLNKTITNTRSKTLQT